MEYEMLDARRQVLREFFFTAPESAMEDPTLNDRYRCQHSHMLLAPAQECARRNNKVKLLGRGDWKVYHQTNSRETIISNLVDGAVADEI